MSCTDWPENPEIGRTETRGDITYQYMGNGIWEGMETSWTYTREVMWSNVPKEDDPGNPTTHPANWSFVGGSLSNWRAEREFKNGQWGVWTVVLTGGSNGVSSFQSMVFVRATEQPAAPTGGSFDDPVPDGWSDGVPAGEHILWMTTRVFSQDGNPPQTATWTTPRQMTDTATLDIEWSSVEVSPGNPTDNPENWHNDATPDEWWKAERVKVNGIFGAWQVVKVRGEDGEAGSNGDSSFQSMVFLRATEQPATPVGGSYADPVPDGWYDGVPAGEYILWMATRVFSKDGSPPQTAAWTTPRQMTDTATLDIEWSSVEGAPGNPTDNPGNWHNDATPYEWWKAERVKVNGVFGEWQIVKVRGEDGTDGADGNKPYMSFAFLRADASPPRPPNTEGSWANPTPAGWFDGIPVGTKSVFITQRMFTSDGLAPQDAEWSVPTLLTSTAGLLIRYSAIPVNPGNPTDNPPNWHEIATPSDIWMATQVIQDGIPQAWQVAKIKGEDGSGTQRGFNFFTVPTADGLWVDATASAAVPGGVPVTNDVVTIYKVTDTSINTTKFWNGGAWEAPAEGGLFFGSIIVDGSVIARHIAASISMTTPRMNGGVLNGGTVQLIGSNYMLVQSHTPFGPDNLLEWRGPVMVTGTGDDMNPDFANMTKLNALSWFDTNGDQYYGGQISAGILRTSTKNPTKTPYVENEVAVSIGPFSSNGGSKNVVVSWGLNGSEAVGGGSCPASPVTATMSYRLERKVGTGAWVVVDTGTFTGGNFCEDGEGTAYFNEYASGSATFTDTTAVVDDFTYQVVVTNYARFLVTANIQSQALSLISTED